MGRLYQFRIIRICSNDNAAWIQVIVQWVYTSVGNAIDPWSYVQQITMGGIKFVRGEDGVLRDPNPAEKQERTAITADEVQITNQADFNTPGTYEILYQITDDSGKESVTGQVRLIVVVR